MTPGNVIRIRGGSNPSEATMAQSVNSWRLETCRFITDDTGEGSIPSEPQNKIEILVLEEYFSV